MILVAGGTGRLGTLVVRDLAERGQSVRVLTRDLARARHLESAATEIVTGDVRQPGTLRAAVQGTQTVISAVHGFAGPGRVSPASVDRDGNTNLISAAGLAGADVVLMSVVGASPDSRMDLFRAKFEAEQHLRESGVEWTIVRSTAFVELWTDLLSKGIVFGRGDNPINFVSVHDVAAAVTAAAIDPSLRGEVIEIGGPENLTFNELASRLQRVKGHSMTMRHIPRWALSVMAPLNRQPRAALAMDTSDMTFEQRALPKRWTSTGMDEALSRLEPVSSR